jgi:hypothetical protein
VYDDDHHVSARRDEEYTGGPPGADASGSPRCFRVRGVWLIILAMAKCDEGYLCEVCGEDVANLVDSDLYLRYVIGLIDPEVLHTQRERHIRCNPVLAQFIVDDGFVPVVAEGDFDKRLLDANYVREREGLVTRGYRRLKELATLDLPIIDYPLPEVRARILERAHIPR